MILPKAIDPTKIPIRASTQEHLDIEDIQEGIVILKDGSSCLIIETTAINFGLLSEKEQESTIYAYAGLLNSLNFYIQLLIRSQRKDISSYIRLIDKAEAEEPKQEVREQIKKYRNFISELVSKNNVLDKKFYIVIPMSSLEIGAAKVLTANFKKASLPFEKSYILEKSKINLYPKRDHILKQLARLGLNAKQLKTQELIKLFFNIYNPEVKGQRLNQSSDYAAPIVSSRELIQPQEDVKPSAPPESFGLDDLQGKIEEKRQEPQPETEPVKEKQTVDVFKIEKQEEEKDPNKSIQDQVNDMINKSL